MRCQHSKAWKGLFWAKRARKERYPELNRHVEMISGAYREFAAQICCAEGGNSMAGRRCGEMNRIGAGSNAWNETHSDSSTSIDYSSTYRLKIRWDMSHHAHIEGAF